MLGALHSYKAWEGIAFDCLRSSHQKSDMHEPGFFSQFIVSVSDLFVHGFLKK